MPENLSIKVENLSKVYHLYDSSLDRLKESFHPLRKKYHHDFMALNGVDFQVQRGETLGIIGRNGSGKSTLLKALAGVLTPTSGSVDVKGRVLALLELGAGFNPELTGIENIFFYSTILGLSSEEVDEKLDAVLDFADIGDYVYHPVKTYSSGMYVRLAFAVIANMDADVLIIDEALAIGDAFFVQKCMRFLRNFIENGTLIFVSHDTNAVTSLCSRAIWLKQGCVCMDGSPKDVSEAYLADYYEDQQGESVPVEMPELPQGKEYGVDTIPDRDMRLDFINKTNLRNDIELFEFNDKGSVFGAGGAEILNVEFNDENGARLLWCVGGEIVTLKIKFLIKAHIDSLITGFLVKDKYGQIIFADNTYLTYVDHPVSVLPMDIFETLFRFRIPVMPCGEYSVSVAIADGALHDHVQQRWINDVLVFKIDTTSVCYGLVGVPMREIKISKCE